MGNYFDKYDEAPDSSAAAESVPVSAAPPASGSNYFDKYDEPAAPEPAPVAHGEPAADQPGTWSDIGMQALRAVPRAGLGMVDALTATPMFRAANNLRRIAGKEELPTFRPAVESALPEKFNPDAPANLPKNRGERLTDMAVQGLVGGVGPGGLGVKAAQAVKGLVSGVGAGVAQEAVPEKYKGVAGLVGGILGGGAAELPQAGWSGVKKAGSLLPVTAGQQEKAAAQKILDAASDPRALRAGVAKGEDILVPESRPTTFQQTGDMGLGALERANAAENPELYKQREADQNLARTKVLHGVQNLGDSGQFGDFIRQQMDSTNAANDAAIASARRRAEAAATGLGPEKSGEAIGASIRTPAQKALDAQNAAEQAMWRAVPKDVYVVSSPIKAAVQGVYGALNERRMSAITGPEKLVTDLVGDYGEHIPFAELSSLRADINTAMMKANMSGDTTVAGRMKPLRTSIEDAMKETLKQRAAEDEAAVAAGKMKPEDTLSAKLRAEREQFERDKGRRQAPEGTAATGTGDASGIPPVAGSEGAVGTGFRDPSGNIRVSSGVEGGGQRVVRPGESLEAARPVNRIHYPGGSVQATPEVVELSDLVKSHHGDFTENADYPQELQPRDRTEKASQDQVNGMAADPKPDLLMPSPEINSGAPLVGPDNVVESGNGRTLMLEQLYSKGKAGPYKEALKAAGHDVSGFQQPVLVSRRVTGMTPAERQYMAHSATGSGLRQSAVGQAAQDANFLTEEVMAKAADKPLTHEDNIDFVKSVIAKFPAAERGDFMDKNGVVSQNGIQRIKAAVAARAYDDNGFLRRAFESTDNNIKNLAGALVDSAIPWAKMRDAAQSGAIDMEHDVTAGLMSDVRAIMRARDEGVPIADVINQQSLFGEPAAHDLLFKDAKTGQLFSRARIAANLEAHAAESLKNEAGPSLFGDSVNPRDVMKAAVAKAGRETGPEVEAAAAPAAEAAVGPGATKAEEPASGGATFATGAKEKPPGPKLITQEGADAIRTATAAHKEKKTLFGVPELKGILKRKFETSPYEVDDAGVAGKFWRTGPEGGIAIKRLMAATKNAPDAIAGLKDAAVHSLQKVMRDGVLPDAAFQNWRRQHGEALRRLDALRRRAPRKRLPRPRPRR